MGTNGQMSEEAPPSYKYSTAPSYPQSGQMPMSMPMDQRMPPTMHQPMLQPQMQQPHGTYPVDTFNMTPAGSLHPRLFPGPTVMMCPSCKNQILTRVEYKISFRTHALAFCCCIIGCIPFMWVPYCTKHGKSPHHYCPTCNHYIGVCTDFRTRYYDYEYSV